MPRRREKRSDRKIIQETRGQAKRRQVLRERKCDRREAYNLFDQVPEVALHERYFSERIEESAAILK